MNVPLETAARCPLCDAPLIEADRCSKCDWVREEREQGRVTRDSNPRNAAAALMSVVPGAGHIFKGYKLAGWVIMLLGVPVVCVFAFAFTMFFGWLLVPAYWIAVGADAYLRKDLGLSAPKPSS
jgi:hypothetical protein